MLDANNRLPRGAVFTGTGKSSAKFDSAYKTLPAAPGEEKFQVLLKSIQDKSSLCGYRLDSRSCTTGAKE